MLRTLVFTLMCLGAVIATTTSDEDQTNVQDLGNKIAEHIPENVPFDTSNLPTPEEAEELFKEKCLKLGGEGAFEKAKKAKEEMQNCALSLVNVTELEKEMDLAKPSGDLDVVFRKYCKKSPQLYECITNFTSALEPCMEEKEKESKRIIHNITDALLNFVCFKEGDRIALFIAEGGPECLKSQEEPIKECLNQTIGRHAPAETVSMNSLPLFVLEDKECRSFAELQKCVVEKLETCSEPTPANIVESLFKFIIKMTPCSKILSPGAETQTGAGSASTAAQFGILLSSLVLANMFK